MVRSRIIGAVAAVLVVAVGGAVLIGLVAWLGDEEQPTEPAIEEPNDEPEPPRAPLTGLPLDDPDELDHPAVAIKVSDVEEAHPQAGLDRADIVFAQPIGVNYTRLTAVFHSQLTGDDPPGEVGPVRSVRPADAPLLGPIAGVFGNTMSSEWILDYVYGATDLEDLGSLRVTGTGAYTVDGNRPQPDHVFAHPSELLALSDRTDPPEPYFAYAGEGESSSAERAGEAGSDVRLSYGPNWPVRWTYDADSERYLREQPWGPHVLVDDTQVSATNVVVIQVGSETGKIGDGGGQPVPILDLVDSEGTFLALSGGAAVTGSWSKGGENEPFELRTDDEELELAPGTTWVELPEPGAELTTS
ncbi:DUF3048 domain-containing protein [Haloechinothrix sp. LS1_15]|uniref:DUF3048 domain-containing protein n=1 Tax=Haloechinothrix sp. LS1_15 TaxID=2652248 RepID=UPI002947F390|nr:DUF3048 domain-containing protein [Haloechinothrix sp. LS1_15]MDV6014271.1 DUF3048 domain-containing protein [Haloechinothrix sp. LS1_15]